VGRLEHPPVVGDQLAQPISELSGGGQMDRVKAPEDSGVDRRRMVGRLVAGVPPNVTDLQAVSAGHGCTHGGRVRPVRVGPRRQLLSVYLPLRDLLDDR